MRSKGNATSQTASLDSVQQTASPTSDAPPSSPIAVTPSPDKQQTDTATRTDKQTDIHKRRLSKGQQRTSVDKWFYRAKCVEDTTTMVSGEWEGVRTRGQMNHEKKRVNV
jgi:hypothetical protein